MLLRAVPDGALPALADSLGARLVGKLVLDAGNLHCVPEPDWSSVIVTGAKVRVLNGTHSNELAPESV